MKRIRLEKGPVYTRIAIVESEKCNLQNRQALCSHEYAIISAAHALLPAADRPTLVQSYANRAKALRFGVSAGGILASFAFAVLNLLSLTTPAAVTVIGSVIVAVLIGCLGHCVVASLVPVDIMDPRSNRRANCVLIAGGLVAVASFAIFLYLRFSDSDLSRSTLPAIAMAFELGLLVFVAAAWEILPLYNWPEKLTQEFENANRDIARADAVLAACKTLSMKEDAAHEDQLDAESDCSGELPGDRKTSSRKSNGSAADHSGLH